MERKIFAYANIIGMIIVGISMMIYISHYEKLNWYTGINDKTHFIFILFIPVMLICGEILITLKRSLPLDILNPILSFLTIPFILFPAIIDKTMGSIATGIGAISSMTMLLIMATSFMYNIKRIKHKNGNVKSYKNYRVKK